MAIQRVFRGPADRPVWERPALLALLLSNAVLYLSNLGVNGWANYFYSAAVQAGSMDAKAFFFGSSDWGNSITVDKPPLSLWVMGLFVRLFGFSPVAMLLPQAIMGVITTFLIYVIIRRHFSGPAALFGAFVFFTTPIVTLMSRYNNPDPLMLLLMVAAVYYVLRSIESGRGRFFIVAAALLGLAFMTKQMQGLLSVPALGIAYLIFSPQRWSARLKTSLAGLTALVITGGFWTIITDLIPQDQRPYIGGSQTNSVLQLTLGYNGIERIVGTEAAPSARQIPDQFRPVDSDTGFFRLLNYNYNQEATWLLFATLMALVMLAVLWNKHLKTPAARALSLASGLWLLTAFLLLCFMGDQIHTYYTIALAPPLALVLGIALGALMATWNSIRSRLMAAAIALTAILTSWLILGGTMGWPNWLSTAVLGVGIASISALLVRPPSHKVEAAAAVVLCASLLFGPVLTSIHNVTVGFNGSNPLSGVLSKNPAGISHLLESLRKNDPPWAHDVAFGRIPEAEVVDVLAGTRGCTWAAATYASQTAARLQLESGRPVMAMGGFAGSDPSPGLDDFKAKVAEGKICYLIQQETFLEVQTSESNVTAISTWVQSNFRLEKIGTTTVFRLRAE
ncbi:glycosyltransferase family 39 protein [Arthrobacter sp. ISL-28]|uniref:ArnT family glycosyltransferase n=1 Tax=Arthrobacter sp. ISL-28 TaxID=2819108 RepID=UPI001BE66B8D|nr:glycosyltransferase family 39 protein [Arthrobacter sp. ISL-28]MBT2521286.1 glycosyltransferase family 39 protein [Arthrobacter sp. ISL-28]